MPSEGRAYDLVAVIEAHRAACAWRPWQRLSDAEYDAIAGAALRSSANLLELEEAISRHFGGAEREGDRATIKAATTRYLDRIVAGEAIFAVRVGEQLPYTEPMDDEPERTVACSCGWTGANWGEGKDHVAREITENARRDDPVFHEVTSARAEDGLRCKGCGKPIDTDGEWREVVQRGDLDGDYHDGCQPPLEGRAVA